MGGNTFSAPVRAGSRYPTLRKRQGVADRDGLYNINDFSIRRSDHDMNKTAEQYWKANIRLVTILLVIWFICSYLFGIILVEPLNTIKIGGLGLGFWFAQNGSIYTFLILIYVYVKRMNALDVEFDVHED
jgi:putative solute:sodium symporter small subunit